MVERLGAVSATLGIWGSFKKKKKLTLFSRQTHMYVYVHTSIEWREWLFIFLGEGNE